MAQGEKYQIAQKDGEFAEWQQSFNVPGSTDPQRFVGDIMVMITGTATSVTYRVERASYLANTALESSWAPADELPFDRVVNPATGAEPMAFREPAIGWWRVRISAISGGTATVNLIGGDA